MHGQQDTKDQTESHYCSYRNITFTLNLHIHSSYTLYFLWDLVYVTQTPKL